MKLVSMPELSLLLFFSSLASSSSLCFLTSPPCARRTGTCLASLSRRLVPGRLFLISSLFLRRSNLSGPYFILPTSGRCYACACVPFCLFAHVLHPLAANESDPPPSSPCIRAASGSESVMRRFLRLFFPSRRKPDEMRRCLTRCG